MVSKQTLAVALSELKVFEHASLSLEQYATESDLAAELLWHAHLRGLLDGKTVVDLGAGTGVLAIGAAALGAARIICVEKDEAALKVLRENAGRYEGVEERLDIIHADVMITPVAGDIVIMNPPFGTKEKHADRVFLERAVKTAPVIYTIHKSTTERFVEAFCEDAHYEIAWRERRSFPLKRTMGHHEKERGKVEVTLFCLERKAKKERKSEFSFT